MTWKSKAPLRIGLAGGGTDVSPYSDLFGGAVLNAAISLYAYAGIESLETDAIIISDTDRQETQQFDWAAALPLNGRLDLPKAVYNRMQRDYGFPATGFRLSVAVDAPMGSGLGSSSTLVVAIVGAFTAMLELPLGSYELAKYAYDIERNDLGLPGGKQDQYAASFGGINFMEFTGDVVTVNPLAIKSEYIEELQHNLLLYFTGIPRDSNAILREQVNNVYSNNTTSIAAMHHLKEQALLMKTALLEGRLDSIGELLDFGFLQKKQMAGNISTPHIESIYAAAKQAGASGGKISGAGGGGFMIFYCPGDSRQAVADALSAFGGSVKPYAFTGQGLTTWTE